jgi:peptidoglycan/LPS O-acetylase OafA/YrhL
MMSSSPKRIPSLDGLRALAIIFVIVFHAAETDGFPPWLRLSSPYGSFGVRIFFVISGYLITTLLLKEKEKTGTISLWDFYVRRAYRILPAAYAYILCIAIIGHNLATWKDFLTSILYVENYYGHAPVFWHLWSLSIEEQFYLLWPALLLFFFRKRVPIVIFGLAMAPFFRGFAYVVDQKEMLVWFPAVQDALATGCLMALLGPRLNSLRRWTDRLIVPIAVLVFALPGLSYPHGVQPLIILSLTNFGIAICIDHCIRHPYRLLNNPPVEWVGRLSYSLYLWQEPFLFLQNVHRWWTRFPINILLALVCACASYYCIERPFLALRDRIRSTRKSTVLVTEKA